MSLAEKTNTSNTSKKPRLYSRGNDQINLDDYIRNLESGFDAWLNSRKIKDKHKDAVREAYREMVTRLNSGDGSFTSRLGGGFQDSTGKIKNADKGFDATGIAASYLGHTLRSMDIYKEPESTPDSSKIKYGDGALRTALTRRLLGSAGTIQDFIDRDPYNKDTRTRGNAVRSKDFRELLSTAAADLRAGTGEFSDWTEDLRTKSAADLEGLFTIFDNDGQITDDEYLQLARVTGMSDLRKMFATGEGTAPTVVAPDGTLQRSGRTYADKIRAIGRKWKPYTGKLIDPISFVDYSSLQSLDPNILRTIGTALNNASTLDLTELIKGLINSNDYRNLEFIKKLNLQSLDGFPLGMNFPMARSFLLNNALLKLKGRTADHNGGLHNFGESNLGTYYIGGTLTDRNTGFVWDSNNNTISEMSIHNIPYWQNYIENWWDTQDTSDYDSDLDPTLTSIYQRKEGGVLFAQAGAIMDRHKGRGPGITGDNTWLSVPNTATNAYNIGTWDNYYNNAGIDNDISTALNWRPRPTNLPAPKLANDDPNATLVRQLNFMDLQDGNYSQALLDAYLNSNFGPENVNKFWDYGYRVDELGHPIKGDDGQDLHGISAKQLGIYLNQLNQLGSGLSWDKTVNDKGYEAWNRKFDQTGLNIYFGGDSDKFDLMGPSTWNRHALLQRMLKTYNKDNPLRIGNDEIYWDGNKWTMPLLENKPTISNLTAPAPDLSKVKLKLSDTKKVPTNVYETGTKEDNDKSSGGGLLNTALNIAPELLSASRLYASLRANRKIEDVLKVPAMLYNPINMAKPILGDFATRLNYRREGAEFTSLAERMADSDPSRNTARMFEAQRMRMDADIKGDLADNVAIQKSREDAFNLQKELLLYNDQNVYRRNRELAYLKRKRDALIHANRLGKDWKGKDNFLGGIEASLIADRAYRRELGEDIAYLKAAAERELAMEPWRRKILKYLSDPKNTDITKMPGYEDYLESTRDIQSNYLSNLNKYRLSLYRGPFSSILYAKSGTKLEPKVDYIAQIVKLNNERNS